MCVCVCVAVTRVALQNTFLKALTEMQTSESCSFVGKRQNFGDCLHMNSLRETFLVGAEISQASDAGVSHWIENKHNKDAVDVL